MCGCERLCTLGADANDFVQRYLYTAKCTVGGVRMYGCERLCTRGAKANSACGETLLHCVQTYIYKQ